MAAASYESSVFINCPFDEEYAPILQAILFCIVYLNFTPRIATERNNSAENRLDKIVQLIKASKYSIHDLSRCEARARGEHFRLNMPLELGIDYGCRQFYGKGRNQKRFLVLEEKRFRYQATISDLSGCDVEMHEGKFDKAVRKVRNWLVTEARITAPPPAKILGAYIGFQEWNYERQLAAGFSEEDIQDYPTNELLDAMLTWMQRTGP